MTYLFSLAFKSAWNRRLTLGITIISIVLSVSLLLGVKCIQIDARDSFSQSISGTDLIVGARTSPIQLMLYSVFHIGEATNNINWKSYQDIVSQPAVAWAIPISLGDSHQGFSVVGTTVDYFRYFHYGESRPLHFSDGKQFGDLFDAVIGADVAQKLGYRVGSKILLSHGIGNANLIQHKGKPFTVTGVLARTGTPVDQTIHVGLQAIEAIHLEWQGGAPLPGVSIPAQYVKKFDLSPKSITAILVGLKSRIGVFKMQRYVNDYAEEPLLAVLPGVALSQLWQMLSVVEKSLFAISGMVAVVSLCGLVAVILAGLNERRRELAILRSVGAKPMDIFLLLIIEGIIVTLLSILLSLLCLYVLTTSLAPFIQANYGLVIYPRFISLEEAKLLLIVIGIGFITSWIPAYRAYRLSLGDGLTPRI